MRGRTRARQIALKTLFQVDLVEADISDTLEYFQREERPPRNVLSFARELVEGVCEHLDEIDSCLKAHLENWDFSRIGNVEKTILRLAAFELLYRPDTPPRVVLNEALELGKDFTTRQSVRFINGVLDALKTAMVDRPAPTPTGSAPDPVL